MRGVIFLCFLFFTFLPFVYADEANSTITGKVITGEATSHNFQLSITVVQSVPSLTLHSPYNGTYFNSFLPIIFSVSGEQAIWYKLDGAANVSLESSPTLINVSQGNHTFFLYANSSQGGLTSKNVSFFVNSSLFFVNSSVHSGANTTNLSRYSYEQLQNLNNVSFEKESYGKIYFAGAINYTSNAPNGVLDLNNPINISFNYIELNSTALTSLNTSATLTLYDLSFSNPRILRNGDLCSSSICTLQSYNGNDLVFNVSHFSSYSAEESPEDNPSNSGSSGGGGRGGGGQKNRLDAVSRAFTLLPDSISVSLKKGETTQRAVTIINNERTALTLKVATDKLNDFIKLSSSDLTIQPGESKTFDFDILVRESQIPDVYIGKIIFSSSKGMQEVLIAISVSTKKSLFDVKISVPSSSLYVFPGDDLVADLELFNLGETERIDAIVKYSIRNTEGQIVSSEEETVAVETRLSLTKSLRVPNNLPVGSYILYVTVYYDGLQDGSSSTWFYVVHKSITFKEKVNYFLVFLVLLTCSIIIWQYINKSSQYSSIFDARALHDRGYLLR